MDNNKRFAEDNNKLILLCTTISGNESLLGDIFGKIKEISLMAFREIGSKAADAVVKLMRQANMSMVKAYGSNQQRLNNAKGHLKLAVKERDFSGFTLSKTFLESTTSNGKMSDIIPSVNELIATFSIIDKHRLSIEAFYHKELGIFQEYKKIKTTEDAVNVLKSFDGLTYPDFSLPMKKESSVQSHVLPGGKIISFTKESHRYSLLTEDVTGESASSEFSTDEGTKLFDKLKSLDEVYRTCHKGNVKYIEYLNKYNTVVKEAFNHIDSLKGEISNSLIRDLLSRLEGNAQVFSFYTGFLPKVMNYVDSYMVNTTDYLTKQFN